MSNEFLGSSFDEFLADDGILEEVTEIAAKRVLARSMAAAIEACGKTKTEIARIMGSSRSQANRLLDEYGRRARHRRSGSYYDRADGRRD